MKSRKKKAKPKGLAELLEQLSKNPEDVAGLTLLGTKFLDAGDPHAARLVFARAVGVGGEAEAYNLLGIASAEVGDVSGAFGAFSQASVGGLEAGRKNLKKLLKQVGLSGTAKEVEKQFRKGKSGGRLLR